MEASRGKGPSTSRRGLTAVGKENVCPVLNSKEHLSASRSPLPENFPRAPLQDITHVLSPVNILPGHEGEASTELGQCRHGRKRPKCGDETHTSALRTTRSEREQSVSDVWKCLKKCATLHGTNNDGLVTSQFKLSEAVTQATTSTRVVEETSSCTASAELIEQAETTHALELREGALLCREARETEMFKLEAEEISKTARTKLKRPAKFSESGPATRASLRSSTAEKQKMSSLLKFR